MAYLSHAGCVYWAVFTVMILPPGSCNPVVNTTSGLVRGLHLTYDDGESVKDFYVYKGIPYAKPPVGPLRFKAPVAKAPWNGVFNASSYGPSCPQRIADVATFYPEYVVQIPEESLVVDEDCLTLNVFSPFNISDGSAAVMLWIHGGSFENGQGSGYDASALATRGNVVVVTINYRLNIFGFMCTNDDSSPGNYGFLDQQLALKWVHENIAAFGGDPSRVTLIGQSAGGASVFAHLYFNESRPLFRRVAAHSGSFRPGYAYGSAERYSEKAREIGAAVGCASNSTSEDLVNCLRGLSMDDLLASALHVSDKSPSQIFGSVFDGIILSKTTGYLNIQHDVMALHTSGDGSTGLEVINKILQNKTDSKNGITESEWDEFLKAFGIASSVAINYEYIDRSIEDANLARMKAMVDLFLDFNFLSRLPGVLEVVPNASSVHVSVFDHHSTANTQWPNLDKLVPHSEEISYLFGLPFNGSGLGSLFTDEERTLSDRVIKYWSNFAKNGDPNVNPDQATSSGDGLTYWPQYGDSEKFLLIGLTNSSVGEGYRQDKVAFWTSYIPSLRLEAILSCFNVPGEDNNYSFFSPDGESEFVHRAGPDQPQCGEVIFGESLGFKLTKRGTETLIEVLLFGIVALLVILVLSFGAVLGYKFKGTKATSTEDVRKMNSFDVNDESSKVRVNEDFEDDSKM